ncbi:MAG: ABC transporter ATP-binding protein [Pontiellaceae bacterium]
MANILFNSVSKKYVNNITAVNDISFEVKAGELLILCGPSGCGKSTVLRMLAGLEDISSGEISVDDVVINQVAPKDRDIAMVFQNYAIYPHMTVFDNIAFSLKLRKVSKDEIKNRVERTAETLGLKHLLGRKPKTLSGGQRQRIAMGRAIVREPAIYLFDEPLSNLDAKMRTELRKEILQIHNDFDATMVYVTHDQIEAMTLGDRICVMNEGVIEQIDPPHQIFDYPKTLFVAQFIGTPPMNTFKGKLLLENNQVLFSSNSIKCPLNEEKTDMLRNHINKEVYLGIRPSHLSIAEDHETNIIEGSLEVSEMLGDEVLIHAKSEDGSFSCKVDPQKVNNLKNNLLRFSINITKAHIFDADSGENLTIPTNI